jgi:3-phenylpropionate/cinnamic acid dioxygenase small subunit
MDVRSAIANVLSTYAWCYDVGELDGIGECFALDAEVTFADVGRKTGRTAVAAEMARRRGLHPPDSTPWHVISNVVVQQDGPDVAKVKSFYTYAVVALGSEVNIQSVGYYDDEFRRDGVAWQIWRRTIVPVGGRRQK